MGLLHVDVALTTADVRPYWMDKICIVIDVICTSSTIVTLLEKGSPRVYPVRAIAKARALAIERGCFIGGERNGLALPGFDLDNSPFNIHKFNVQGKNTVLTTTNGTRAINKVAASRVVLMGCFLNAEACCQSALELAHKYNTGLGLVCAGTKGKFALDDALCAGYLVKTLLRIGDQDITLSDAALASKRLYEVYPNIQKGFMDSASGKRLIEINHEQDLTCCSMVNIFHVVPILIKDVPYYFKRLE